MDFLFSGSTPSLNIPTHRALTVSMGNQQTVTRPTRNRIPMVWVMGACIALTSPFLYASEMQVGRYSLRSTAPTKEQTDLLATTVAIRFPDRVQTIGESVRYLLQQSGYRLANSAAISPETKSLLLLPLPAVHRHLGPIPLKRALETLAGPAFRLVQDPIHRLVSFELCTKERAYLTRSETPLKHPHQESASKPFTNGQER